MGQIYSNNSWATASEIEDKYLGTSYILSNKADFEPRKNV